MRNYSPHKIALYTALCVSGITALLTAVISFLQLGAVDPLLVVSNFVGVGVASYFVFKYTVDRFIYERIKVIYKTIHNLKSQKNHKEREIEKEEDPIGTVNAEVLDWASHRGEEIEALKKQEAYRREFIGNLAHELKTPMFNMQGYLFSLLEGGLDDDTVNYEYLSRADNNLERLIDLVESMDSITKLESGKEELHMERFDLVLLARECLDSLELTAKQKDITLRFREAAEKPIWVKADKRMVMQVLTNLTANSINYGEDGGETEIRFYDMDVNILVEIADNGLGIAEKHLDRLFERFYRIDKSRARHQGGSGLGLAIVKHIIDAHNQTINVRSTEGVGSTFSFTLEKAR